jgi:hypothetical protein
MAQRIKPDTSGPWGSLFHKPGNHGPLGPCADDCPACLSKPRRKRSTYDSPGGQAILDAMQAARDNH